MKNLLNKVAQVILYCAKVVHICHLLTWMLCCPIYYLCSLPPLSNLKVTCPWLLTGYLLLDLHHARHTQDRPINHGPLRRQRPQKGLRNQFLEHINSTDPHIQFTSEQTELPPPNMDVNTSPNPKRMVLFKCS